MSDRNPDQTLLGLLEQMAARQRTGIPTHLPEGCSTKGGDSRGRLGDPE